MLREQNLIDAAECVGKSCLDCSMLTDTKQLLDTCLELVAKTALELLAENKSLKQQITYETEIRNDWYKRLKIAIEKLVEDITKTEERREEIEQSHINGPVDQRP